MTGTPNNNFSSATASVSRMRFGWMIIPFIAHNLLLIAATVLPPVYRNSINSMNFQSNQHLWFQWDSLWFISIGKLGYTHLPGILKYMGTAFFPLVPILVRVFGQWTVLVLEQFVFILTLILLKRLSERMGLTHSQAVWAAWLFALNPAAIFYSTIYAEPWTVVCILGSFFLAVRRRWVLAAVVGALAAMTQGTGILVGIFPLVLLIRSIRTRNNASIRGALVWGIGCAAGLAAYMAYLGYAYHQPLLFSHVQSTIWNAHWALPWYPFTWAIRYTSFGIHHKSILVYGFIVLLDIIGLALFWVFKQAPLVRWERWAVTLYGTLGIVVSMCFASGHHPFWSTVRIASVYFPIYIGWATQRRGIRVTVLIVFASVAFIGASLFTHGYFYQ